ncbi:MAG: hypothetical protein JNM86_05275 [Phycisphaerae bacterium]|nr:hypothetical protein [Phycisphaerae bacterium]MBN8598076.1 hypothetical protein [Planctomycetota bacterium]
MTRKISASWCQCRGGPLPGALMVSVKQNSPELGAGGMRTNSSSPMAGNLIGGSVKREWRNETLIG